MVFIYIYIIFFFVYRSFNLVLDRFIYTWNPPLHILGYATAWPSRQNPHSIHFQQQSVIVARCRRSCFRKFSGFSSWHRFGFKRATANRLCPCTPYNWGYYMQAKTNASVILTLCSIYRRDRLSMYHYYGFNTTTLVAGYKIRLLDAVSLVDVWNRLTVLKPGQSLIFCIYVIRVVFSVFPGSYLEQLTSYFSPLEIRQLHFDFCMFTDNLGVRFEHLIANASKCSHVDWIHACISYNEM